MSRSTTSYMGHLLAGFSLLLVLILLPILIISQFQPYYFEAFTRYDIYQGFTTSDPNVIDSQFASLLQFIRPPFNSALDNQFFSSEDIAHMGDVRNLFIGVWICTGMSATLFTIYLSYKLAKYGKDWLKATQLFKYSLRTYTGIIIIFICLGVLAALYWQQAFELFHRVLFPTNNYWILDPQTSNLIKYLPSQIFQELGGIYVLINLIELVILRKLKSE